MTVKSGTKGPIEKKVKASTVAAYLASVAALAIVGTVSDNPMLVAGLPDLAEALLLPLLPALATLFAGYKAQHTPRPDLAPDETAPPVPPSLR